MDIRPEPVESKSTADALARPRALPLAWRESLVSAQTGRQSAATPNVVSRSDLSRTPAREGGYSLVQLSRNMDPLVCRVRIRNQKF